MRIDRRWGYVSCSNVKSNCRKRFASFTEERYEVGDRINHPDGILLRSYSLHQEEFSKDLKAIARAGAGVNNIPVERCTEKGIVVFNTPGANANAVKELIIASLIMSSRNIINGVSWTKT